MTVKGITFSCPDCTVKVQIFALVINLENELEMLATCESCGEQLKFKLMEAVVSLCKQSGMSPKGNGTVQ